MALAERAMSLWPNKGHADTRPPMGSGYERFDPVMPDRPFVPAGAVGELRLDAKAADVVPAYPISRGGADEPDRRRALPHHRAGRNDPRRVGRSPLPRRGQAPD